MSEGEGLKRPHIRKSPSRLCDEPGCEELHLAQGRCRKHYSSWRKSPDFKPALPNPTWHRILETSPDGMTGTCAQCGTVDIVWRGEAKRPVCHPREIASKRKERERVRGSDELRAARNAYHAKYARATKYGLTYEELDSLLASITACEICGSELTPSTAHIDHDHSCCAKGERVGCGECLRGLLCNGCNTGLGLFRDDPQRLQAAIEYLARPRTIREKIA